jgi:hypothetical protein
MRDDHQSEVHGQVRGKVGERQALEGGADLLSIDGMATPATGTARASRTKG